MAQRNGVPRRGDDGRCPLGDRGANYTDEYRIPLPCLYPDRVCDPWLKNLQADGPPQRTQSRNFLTTDYTDEYRIPIPSPLHLCGLHLPLSGSCL